MWTSKRKLREDIMRLNYRIADLEERLCPCEEHEWVTIDYDVTIDAYGEYMNTEYINKCRRCGKTKKSSRKT